jgi:ribosomal protein L1
MKSATAVKDHVCGMDIETANAAGKSEYKRADVLLLWPQMQGEVRSEAGTVLGQVCGNAEKWARMLRLKRSLILLGEVPCT